MVLYTCKIRIKDAAVRKKLTLTIDEDVYNGLRKVVGPRRISRFLESLARPHVLLADMDEAYAAMAADEARERDALDWAEATVGDIAEFEGNGSAAG